MSRILLSNKLIHSVWLSLLLVLSACSIRSSLGKTNSGGAPSLLESAATIRSVSVVDIESQDTLYRLTPSQVDSLKSALKASFVSESLLLTPSPWPVALVMGAEKGSIFVALHYGDVLRVNTLNPWSTRIADSTGSFPAKGIADIVLNGDDVPWIFALIQQAVGKPPSKTHTVPKIPQLLNPL